ncbi:uncharacterized protein LOC116341167 [Contarinia nasturtii]|uniref:uncharacterized protein LOC116341167 n=1 Tax=Contarinia nasturtii TaxID=265458 RepID=UPI0012D476CC|nr:uncharacterized protein LOC116341167 [Contarinia nasturtii]
MNPILFVAFLSMFPLVQMDDPLTFWTIAVEHDPSEQYRFLLKITKDINTIKKKIEAIPRNNFLEQSTREHILKHVPASLKINDRDARTVLREKIVAINEMQTKTIKQIDETICNRISFKSQGILDPSIVESYKNWVKNPYDNDHLKRIRAEYPTIKSKFENWQIIFIEEMKAADELRDEINANVNASISIIKSILAEPEKASETAELYFNGILDSILKRQKKLAKRLETVADVLFKYNEERMKCIEFLIEMRNGLDSEPKIVQLVPKNQKSKSKKH